ncbi:MAG TPA: ATP-binding protein [Pyrinomonadaceae bacterium]|nr:ATP-binding protein [Pyrinomonadaceae bacterium]
MFVIGPPGAGKTFLCRTVKAEFEDLWAQHQLSDRGRIPVVGIEVPSRDELRPTFGTIYERLLLNMEEPLIEKKTIYGDVTLQRNEGGRLTIARQAKQSKLRLAIEQAFKHRNPYFVFFDEAQQLLGLGGLPIQDNMDCLKSLANMTNCLYVLYGTYEMRSLIDLSDQLIKRSSIIHFRRYAKKGKDKQIFQGVLYSFQINMPFPKEPDLLKHWEFFYDRTLGCIGNLYDWLLQAYQLALSDSNSLTLTEEHIAHTVFLAQNRASVVLRNIETDEKEVNSAFCEDRAEIIQTLLDKNSEHIKGSSAKREGKTTSRSKRRGRVGERNPTRDPTGGTDKGDLAA